MIRLEETGTIYEDFSNSFNYFDSNSLLAEFLKIDHHGNVVNPDKFK